MFFVSVASFPSAYIYLFFLASSKTKQNFFQSHSPRQLMSLFLYSFVAKYTNYFLFCFPVSLFPFFLKSTLVRFFFLHHSTNTGFAKDFSVDRTANSSCLFSVHLLLGLSTVFVIIYHFHFLGMLSLLGVQDTAHS